MSAFLPPRRAFHIFQFVEQNSSLPLHVPSHNQYCHDTYRRCSPLSGLVSPRSRTIDTAITRPAASCEAAKLSELVCYTPVCCPLHTR